MSKLTSKSAASLKFYSEKSKAKRALNAIGVAALQAAEKLLFQGEDGRWGFDMDKAETIQNEADLAKESAAAVAVKNHSTIVRDGKKVVVDGKPVATEKPAPKAVVKPAAPVEAPVAPVSKEDALQASLAAHECPHCKGDPTSQTWANEGVTMFCHSCGTTYSATTGKKVRVGHSRPNASKGYTIQKDRPEQNGIRRPSAGTVCGSVWDAFDANPNITSKELPALAEARGWNKNNVSCEFYQWRKFHGIHGRQA